MEENNSDHYEAPKTEFNPNYFISSIESANLYFSHLLIIRLLGSLQTKPFLILTGLSGSGKTKLAQSFVKWISEDSNQFRIIPVGADWTNREPLFGYPNALNSDEYIKPENGALELLIAANEDPDLPFFLILDEMNLSHVERYFADFLSAMESGEEIFLHSGTEVISGVPPKIRIPKNLFIIGTVNIDETTHMFSPKVLDRANTIEFRITSDEMTDFLEKVGEINMEYLESKGSNMAKSFLEMALDKSVPSEGMDSVKVELGKFFVELKKAGAEFGYRSATEILKLIDRLKKIDPSLEVDAKLDIAIVQKLLPKLHGSRRKLVPVLTTLANLCLKETIQPEKEGGSIESKVFEVDIEKIKYPISFEKLARMRKAAIENGFASFAEA
ncbi:McrB family protein [Algoriphagus taiwanensis]